MALSGTTVGTTIAQLVKAAGQGTINDAALTKLWQDIMNAIYTDIKASAVVSVASVSGVTTGPGVSGPGAGTIS